MSRPHTDEAERALVVSIHDVAPQTRARTDEILAALGRRNVRECSLLVVPDYHGSGLCTEDAEFVAWLKHQASRGHEIVLHGYTHQRRRKKAEGVLKRLVTRVYTADEGEFYDLSEEAALEKLTRAQSLFRSIGVNPRGFIAPAWLLGRAAERAVRLTGFEYTTRLATVTDYVSGRVWRTQSLVWSVRSPWRVKTSLRWNASLAQRLKRNPLLRVGIHPPDFDHPEVREQILQLVRKASSDRLPMTYAAWFDRVRETAQPTPKSAPAA
jgi:predicted deacetylase